MTQKDNLAELGWRLNDMLVNCNTHFDNDQLDAIAEVFSQFLNNHAVKRGGERPCIPCWGVGRFKYRDEVHDEIQEANPCPTCKGTGTLPVEEKSVKEIIEEWKG